MVTATTLVWPRFFGPVDLAIGAWFSKATGLTWAGVAASVSDLFTLIEVSLAVVADFATV